MSNNGVVVWQERVPTRMSYSELEQRVRNVKLLKTKLPFYVGDLVLACDDYGEKGSQLINEFGYSEGALANLRYVAKRFPPDERSSDLPWSWYQAIAPFHKKDRERLITQALSGEINRAGIRALANGANGDASNGRKIVPDAVSALAMALARAYVTVGKLMGRGEQGKLMLDALDELIAAAMEYREKLKG